MPFLEFAKQVQTVGDHDSEANNTTGVDHSIDRDESKPADQERLEPKQEIDDFHKLIEDISKTLGPSSGLDTPDIDPQTLIEMMQKYTSTASNARCWARYAHNDPSRTYTRNLVSSTNPNANILLLVWNPDCSSPIHDHANAHCIMKVLQGTLQETLYHRPPPRLSQSPPPSSGPTQKSQIHIKAQKNFQENEVTYISDQIGLHRISNPSTTDVAVSLHLYTPPHAANFGFNMFDERTGQRKHVKQCRYFSEKGQRCT